MTARFWSPDAESASPEAIAYAQCDSLRRLFRRCARVPSYRAAFKSAGINAEDIREISDLAAVPFFGKAQLRDLQPWGVLAAELNEVVRFNATTGTTGLPCNIAFSQQDLDNIAELGARNLTAMGVRPSDIAWQAYGYGLWIGGSSLDRAFEAVGVTTFPVGPGRTARAVQRLADLDVSVISCTPTFALLLAERAAEAGVNPSTAWKLRVGVLGGETMTPAARRRLTEVMPQGFRAHNTYGSTETEPGVPGELVVTTLLREASPMLRWRTRDLSAWAPDAYDCPCGRRGHPKISWVTGRTDDMIKVRGTLVMPSQVEEIICMTEGTGAGWQLVLDKDPDGLRATEATVYVEVSADDTHMDLVVRTLTARLADRLGIRIPVIGTRPGELPRYEGKARRVLTRAEFSQR